MNAPVVEFSRIVEAARVSASPMSMELSADQAELKALANRFHVISISFLTASVILKRVNRTQIRVKGRFKAGVVQECSVSLKPFQENIENDFSVLFGEAAAEGLSVHEIDLDMENDEDVGFIENGKIDVGEVVAESLSLDITPFPRSEEACFSIDEEGLKDENPFSVLEKLKFK